jgi:hypothetical protein
MGQTRKSSWPTPTSACPSTADIEPPQEIDCFCQISSFHSAYPRGSDGEGISDAGATGSGEERCSVTEKPRELLGLVAEDFGPGPFDPIEAWEHWLCEVQDMPDSPLKDHGIEKAERMIRAGDRPVSGTGS